MDRSFLQNVARAIANTEPNEIGCDDCFAELDRFAELARSGRSVDEIMPRVHDHLQRCDDCHEEYKALLDALDAIDE